VKVVFLGSGGGRFAMVTQKRRTAGIRFLGDSFDVHLDPGPGALVHSWGAGLDPRKINGVLVSHAHPDHYTDAEVLVEAMTAGATRRRGVLAAAKSVLKGSESIDPVISRYHQSLPRLTVDVEGGTKFEIGKIVIFGAEARHSDVGTVGFRIETDVGSIGYTSDSEFYEGVSRSHRDVRVLILCVLRPSGEPWRGHMTTDDAIEIVNDAKPELAVLTHFGMKMILRGPDDEARRVNKETGVDVIAASDGMRMILDDTIGISQPKIQNRRLGLDRYLGNDG
jgi:phosphoribosyl 1,2-cyclic phosphodiesterase